MQEAVKQLVRFIQRLRWQRERTASLPVAYLHFLAYSDGLWAMPAGQVRVLDLAGRLVLAQVLAADANVPALDLSSLPAGLYVVQVEQNGQRFTQRLVHAVD